MNVALDVLVDVFVFLALAAAGVALLAVTARRR
jgi:hypothetical protein